MATASEHPRNCSVAASKNTYDGSRVAGLVLPDEGLRM